MGRLVPYVDSTSVGVGWLLRSDKKYDGNGFYYEVVNLLHCPPSPRGKGFIAFTFCRAVYKKIVGFERQPICRV